MSKFFIKKNIRYNIKRKVMDANFIAGWSSLVARQAHNLKVVGSNPTPATNRTNTF